MFDMAPGVSAGLVREVFVRNTGTVAFTYNLTVSDGGGLLWTGSDGANNDSSDGLQIRLTRAATMLYEGPLNLRLGIVDFGVVVPPGGQDVVEYVIYLPDAAGNEFQALSTTVTFSWTATG